MNTLNLNTGRAPEAPLKEQRRTSIYRELPGLPSETKDVLKQLQANIQSLEELAGRLNFVMSEVRSAIRR